MRYEISKRYEMFMHWLAAHLPRQLIYFASIQLIAHATTGKHSSTDPHDLNVVDALKRWEQPN